MINTILRPFQLSDYKSIALNANNRLIWANLRDRFPYPYSEEDALQFIKMVTAYSPSTEFAVDFNGEAIGAAGNILKDDVYSGSGEIGYWIGQEYWGKGIGTKIVAELLRIAFDDFKLYRVYAEVFDNNTASACVLEKNGFKKEATLKNAIIKDGVRQNLSIYSIINPRLQM